MEKLHCQGKAVISASREAAYIALALAMSLPNFPGEFAASQGFLHRVREQELSRSGMRRRIHILLDGTGVPFPTLTKRISIPPGAGLLDFPSVFLLSHTCDR